MQTLGFLARCALFVIPCTLLAGCEDPPVSQAEVDAIAAMERLHGHVETDQKGHAVVLILKRTRATNVDLAPLEQLPYLTFLSLEGTWVDDAGLAHLAGLNELKQLSLRQTKVKGPGLQHLAKLASLEQLDLEGLPIDAEGMKAIAEMPKLRSVYFDRPGPSNALIDALKETRPRLRVTKK